MFVVHVVRQFIPISAAWKMAKAGHRVRVVTLACLAVSAIS